MRLLKRPTRARKLRMEQGYARIEGEQVLQHETRGDMLRLLNAQPGLSLGEVGARVGLARGPTQWHLDKLERNGYLTRVRHGGETLFFPRALPPAQTRSLAALRHPSRRALLELASRAQGLRPSQAARELGLQPPTIRHHARELLDLGLLAQHGDERAVRYVPTQTGLAMLASLQAPAA
ncbi:MAG: helix-turn-helix domain-containing protein [Halobacteriales archaeon]|nr:helix-turn-helix domain-containing protein [Halobacteriales archaeon]